MWRPFTWGSPSLATVHAYVTEVQADVLDPQSDLDLVVEAEHLQVLGLDLAPGEVAPAVAEAAQAADQLGLGLLRPFEGRGEVDPATRVGVDPGDPRLDDLLDHPGSLRLADGLGLEHPDRAVATVDRTSLPALERDA